MTEAIVAVARKINSICRYRTSALTICGTWCDLTPPDSDERVRSDSANRRALQSNVHSDWVRSVGIPIVHRAILASDSANLMDCPSILQTTA